MKTLALIAALFVSACANPYSQFYKGIPDARLRPGYIPSTEALQIYGTNDFSRDVKALVRRGYVPVGESSSFNAASETTSEAQLREHAQKIGAHIVLVATKFTHSIPGALPLTVPTTTSSYFTGSATAYGRGGPITAYGSGTATTFGTQTTYLHYAVDRADFTAVYLVKSKSRIGLFADPLDDETRRRLGRNTGVRVGVVVEGSPAFEANVLPGDVLISFGGQAVRSVEHYRDLLVSFTGESVELVLDRDGRLLRKIVPFHRL